MSNDDDRNDESTIKLPDESSYDTKPGITAVLERINQLGEQLNNKIDDLQTEMKAGFKRIDQKIDLLHKDILELRTDHGLLAARVDDLEKKAS